MSLENMDASAIAELASLAKSLADDPKTRKSFLKLTKEVRPDVILPELEMENTISEQLASRDTRIKDLETSLAERSVMDDLEAKRGILRKRGADPDEIVEIEKLMVAIHAYKANDRPPCPIPSPCRDNREPQVLSFTRAL